MLYSGNSMLLKHTDWWGSRDSGVECDEQRNTKTLMAGNYVRRRFQVPRAQ